VIDFVAQQGVLYFSSAGNQGMNENKTKQNKTKQNKTKQYFLPIWRCLHRAVIHSVWQSRCKEVFGGEEPGPENHLTTLKSNIKKIITIHKKSKNQKITFSPDTGAKKEFSPHLLQKAILSLIFNIVNR